MCRYPFGSGGKRVTTSETLPSRTSAATISRMKSLRSGVVGLWSVVPVLLVISKRVVGRARADAAPGYAWPSAAFRPARSPAPKTRRFWVAT